VAPRRLILGIDPGPTACGVTLYDFAEERVIETFGALPVDDTLRYMRGVAAAYPAGTVGVAIERVQSYGISGASLLRTSEVVGRLWQCAIDVDAALYVTLVYRRDVLRVLDVTGKGNRDSLVRQRVIEMHGGDRATAVGRKASPGPLYGVSKHGWSALAVALSSHSLQQKETP